METQTQTNQSVSSSVRAESLSIDVSSLPTMEEVERQYLNMVLEKTGGNKPQTAKILGLTVKTIYNKLNSYKAEETASNP